MTADHLPYSALRFGRGHIVEPVQILSHGDDRCLGNRNRHEGAGSVISIYPNFHISELFAVSYGKKVVRIAIAEHERRLFEIGRCFARIVRSRHPKAESIESWAGIAVKRLRLANAIAKVRSVGTVVEGEAIPERGRELQSQKEHK